MTAQPSQPHSISTLWLFGWLNSVWMIEDSRLFTLVGSPEKKQQDQLFHKMPRKWLLSTESVGGSRVTFLCSRKVSRGTRLGRVNKTLDINMEGRSSLSLSHMRFVLVSKLDHVQVTVHLTLTNSSSQSKINHVNVCIYIYFHLCACSMHIDIYYTAYCTYINNEKKEMMMFIL